MEFVEWVEWCELVEFVDSEEFVVKLAVESDEFVVKLAEEPVEFVDAMMMVVVDSLELVGKLGDIIIVDSLVVVVITSDICSKKLLSIIANVYLILFSATLLSQVNSSIVSNKLLTKRGLSIGFSSQALIVHLELKIDNFKEELANPI